MSNVAELIPAKKGLPLRANKKDDFVERERMEAWLKERIAESVKGAVVEVVTLTPALAASLLARNEANRNVSEVALDRFKRDILENRWEFNGEKIVVSKDGKLNDGQHRCRAVVETGRSIRVVIVFGPERESRMTLDQGVTRTVGHYLGMHGHKDANNLAAVANCVWQWKEKGYLSKSPEDRPTKSQTLFVAEHYVDLVEALQYISRDNVGAVCSRPVLAFCYWAIAKRVGSDAAEEFINKLIVGAGLPEGDIILYTRNRLIDMRGGGYYGARAELIFRCWNMHRRGEKGRINLSGKKLPSLER